MELKTSKRTKKPKQIKSTKEIASASSRSKDTIKWTFSKAKRFVPIKQEQTPNYCDLPSTLSEITCSFGYGKRWTPANQTGKDSPPPGSYDPPQLFGIKNKGPTFTHREKKHNFFKDLLPGPGAYDPYSPLGKAAPKFSFRQKFLNKVRISTPPPNSYRPNYKLVEKENYSKVSFGVGDRPQIYGKIENLPGPGSYNIPSCFKNESINITSRSSSPLQTKRPKTPLY